MRAAGTKQFAGSREQVYRAAIDPERLARATPGVQAVEKLEPSPKRRAKASLSRSVWVENESSLRG